MTRTGLINTFSPKGEGGWDTTAFDQTVFPPYDSQQGTNKGRTMYESFALQLRWVTKGEGYW